MRGYMRRSRYHRIQVSVHYRENGSKNCAGIVQTKFRIGGMLGENLLTGCLPTFCL